jgi:hypothetical protein
LQRLSGSCTEEELTTSRAIQAHNSNADIVRGDPAKVEEVMRGLDDIVRQGKVL